MVYDQKIIKLLFYY